MRIKRDELISCLESTRPGLSKQSELDQSNCVCFHGGEILTFNGDVACSIPSPFGEDINGAVPAAPLLAMLHKLDTDEIDVSQGPSEFRVKAPGRRKAGIRMEDKVVLPVHMIDHPSEWDTLHDEFGEAILLAKECASKDAKQFMASCVHIHPKWVESFDNFQMLRYTVPTPVDRPTLVKRSAISHVATMGATRFGETDHWVHFRNRDKLILRCARYVDKFYDLTPNLEVKGTPVSLPRGLVKGTDIAQIFSDEAEDDTLVHVSLEDGSLFMRGEGIAGWYEETREVSYEGPSMSFMISPKLLKKVVEKYNTAIINPHRLKVDGGRWVYLAALGLQKREVKQ